MCSDRLLSIIEKNQGKEMAINEFALFFKSFKQVKTFNPYFKMLPSMLKRFTLDTIWNCGFGMDRNMQTTNNGDIYIEKSFTNAKMLASFSFLMYISSIQKAFYYLLTKQLVNI